MPVFKIFTHTNSKIGVWKLDEEPEHLENLILNRLTDTEIAKYKTFKSVSRRREWLAVRLLLQEMRKSQFYTPIFYAPSCKPFLEDEFIGISHSRSFVAVITSYKSNVAIDIERISDRPVRISSKFVNETEKSLFDIEKNYDMTLLWSIKETVYKFYGEKELSFKDKIIVKQKISHDKFSVLLKNTAVDVYFMEIEDNIMTFIPA